MTEVLLLLSGGVDSTALAALDRPAVGLTIDYGQRPAAGESRAAAAIASRLSFEHRTISVNASDVGAGLLHSESTVARAGAPETWPFRNQLLLTLASAYATMHGFDEVHLGSVRGDGDRHRDGTGNFYALADSLVSFQEGNIRVRAPAVDMDPLELLERSGLGPDVVALTHSCHRASLACGQCPGCWKRAQLWSDRGWT
ncbi:MAG TPA: 7-cyano-7-deazaguanine synthase [Acidimicrobiia bacterium]|jgi:7-cyano-7-deazaguanine synthase